MNKIRILAREPLLHFLLLGAVLYAAIAFAGKASTANRIVIGDREIERIAAIYRQQFGVRPSTEQLERRVEERIREEIYWREGVAMGLHRDDEIVRRRVAQKYAFLREDLMTPTAVAAGELETYFASHRERYTEPARVSFSHIYISGDRSDGERTDLLADIRSTLQANSKTSSMPAGDTFPGQTGVSQLSRRELARIFGDTPIVSGAFKAPASRWAGPFTSGYGDHFIFITHRQEERALPLEAVRDRVIADYRADKRREQNRQAYRELRKKYQVSVEGTL